MIEWVKLSSLIVDQIFNYGPKINDIFKSKEKKHKQFQLKILCNDIANQLQKNLLTDLKTMMDYSINIPLNQEDYNTITTLVNNIINLEQEKIQKKMNDLIINQFNDIIMDNLICTPKYHNLVIVGTNTIYRIINKLYNDNFTVKDNIEKFQLFCTKKAEFRAGLLLYVLNISDKLDILETPINLNIDKDNKDIKTNMKKICNEILVFIKNQNKMVQNDLNRKITGIVVCIDNKKEYEKIKELINFLDIYINKKNYQIDLYLFNINKCISQEMENNIINIEENIIEKDLKDNINNNIEKDLKNDINNNINKNDIENKNNINNIVNDKDEDNKVKRIKCFPISLDEEKLDIDEDEGEKNDIEQFLDELVKKYIDDYMKENIDNINCSLNLQFLENIKYYYLKLEKEFNKAVLEMKNFNLKTIPLKVEFESQIKKIYSDIIINHIFPLSIKPEINKNTNSKLSNESLLKINDFYNYIFNKVKELTNKGKDEYSMRLIGQIKEKINELFNKLELNKGDKEIIEEQNTLKKTFIDDISHLLNEKIAFGSDVYDICLSYFYINKDLFKILSEKIIEYCQKNILENKEFKDGIKKRIFQQIDSYQRKCLNID